VNLTGDDKEEDLKTEKVFSKDSFEYMPSKASPSKFDSQKIIENKNLDGLKINFDSEASKKELAFPNEAPLVANLQAEDGSGTGLGDSATVQVEQLSQNIQHRSSFMHQQNHLDQGSSLAAHSVSKQVSINELANIRDTENAKIITKSAGSFETKKNNEIESAEKSQHMGDDEELNKI